MKRLLSLTLTAALLAALTLPAAAAEESQDARLAKVTALVKSALELDTESFETFRGGLSEELVPLWNLNWEGERRSLSVAALEDGTVVSLSRWEYDPSPSDVRTAFPVFPERGGDADREIAGDFLSRVLRAGETMELKDRESSLGNSSGSSWSGTLSLNGLPSPFHCSIRVENGVVEHFDRDVPEAAVVGGVPGPEPSADAAKAREDLEETLKLQLIYVLDKPDGPRAVLRYVPEPGLHDFLVDAKTGELLDLTELEEKMNLGSPRNAAAGSAVPTAKAEMSADEAGLTKAELEGVRQLEGVLSQEVLDKAVRAESAYGLRGYALTSAAYESAPAGDEGKVFCTLRYARTENGERLTRNITVNAKTGDVEGVWSSAPWGREQKVTEEAALKKAEAFLKAYCPDRDLTLYRRNDGVRPLQGSGRPDWQFTFAREVNGLPFPANAVTVGIDTFDGSVYSLSSSWDEKLTFDDPSGLVSMEAALSAWAGTYESVLAYRGVPQKLTKAGPAQLMEQGMEYYYGLRLTYGLEREEAYSGVDAKTGKPVRETRSSAREPLIYTDLSGSPARADIEKLAQYGVGYAGGKFRPGRSITQWEMVCLVSSLRGAPLDPEAVGREDDGRESAYYDAFRMGLLRFSERDDEALLSRAGVVKMLLNAAGYGPAARLEGIFRCDYADRESIPAEDLGYAAVAQALGLASETYAGARTATRGEAASMLCRVLERTV